MSGFICLHRDAFDHPLLQDGERFRAWFWLVTKAAWKPTRFDISGKIVTLDRGQLCVSRSQLAEAWNWSPSSVERFVARLIEENMIIRETGQGKSIITICNYSKYQDVEKEAGQANEAENSAKMPVQKPDRFSDRQPDMSKCSQDTDNDRYFWDNQEQPDKQPDSVSDSDRTAKEQGNKLLVNSNELTLTKRGREKPKIATRIPDDWKPDPLPAKLQAMVDLWQPDELENCFDEFMDYWKALPDGKAKKLDWNLTWHNQIRRQDRFLKGRKNGTSHHRTAQQPATDPRFAALAGIYERETALESGRSAVLELPGIGR